MNYFPSCSDDELLEENHYSKEESDGEIEVTNETKDDSDNESASVVSLS